MATDCEPAERLSGWVAGLNHGSHDPSCALLHDGQLVITVEQERLSRRKRGVEESPATALKFCLDYAGIDLADVDVVALGSDHDRLARWLGLTPEQRQEQLYYDRMDRLFPASMFGGQLPQAVCSIQHHLAHAASAYWPSGFGECALLVIDAIGEDSSTSIARAGNGRIEFLASYGVETSLGFFYEAASEFVGLGRQDGGKLMGLACYGQPRYRIGPRFADGELQWLEVPPSTATGRALIDERMRSLQDQIARECFPYSPAQGEDVIAYVDVAASAQHALEESVLGLAEHARDLTGCRSAAIAGGVGLNCTANGALVRSGLFDEVFVQPMAHDGGVALGAALAAVGQQGGLSLHGKSRMAHAYWGPPLVESELPAVLTSAGLSWQELSYESLLPQVAKVLAAGGLVAWAQGRAEVGPRALGARSLLGDPRSRQTLIRLNQAKGREMWRPLAPTVLWERFDDYFVGAPNAFMIVAAQVRPEVRQLIPAVVHVDGSARPQALTRAANRPYYDLIVEFERMSGVPLLVNTSLNVSDEPIATSAADVITTFDKSGADAVVLGRCFALRA